MRDLDHALTLIDAVVEAVDVPVTLKMRLGWDDATLNAPELAKRAEGAGIQMITVHGRTRCQFYKGKADWDKIRLVREASSLPLVVNGDIVDHPSAHEAISQSGADAVMVGRGAYGAPWLPGMLAGRVPVPMHHQILPIVLEHYENMLSLYGKEGAIRPARKHLAWYLDHLIVTARNKQLRQQILTCSDAVKVLRLLPLVFESNVDGISFEPESEAA